MSWDGEAVRSRAARGVRGRGRVRIQSAEQSTPARSLIPISSRSVTRAPSGSHPRGVVSFGSSRARASILQSARQVGIHGGTFNTAGTQQFNVTFNLGDQPNEEEPPGRVPGRSRYQEDSGTREAREEAPSIRYDDYDSAPWPPNPPVQRSCDIYYRHIAVKGRGSPLWIPGPNQTLHISYQRQGMAIGDVGIITAFGSFDFLFNICLSQDHPINPPELPENFKPFTFLPYDIQRRSEFEDESHLSSASVKKTRTGDLNGLTFESSASEGAILTMPVGSKSEDIANTVRLRNYVATHAASWYQYIVDVRGREIQNGDVRLVMGWDKTKAWGMASFSNTSAQQEPFSLQFRPIEQGNAGRTYAWEYSGFAEARAGPGAQEKVRIRMDDPSQAGVEYENQCLFIRTLNVTLQDVVWTKLAADFGLVEVNFGEPSNIRDTSSPQLSRERTTSSRGCSRNESQSASSEPLGTGGNTASTAAASTSDEALLPRPANSVQLSAVKNTFTEHPSNGINEILLKLNPTAKMAITEDKDWISVLMDDDSIVPSANQLYERIMASYVVCVEEDILFLREREAFPAIAYHENFTISSSPRHKFVPPTATAYPLSMRPEPSRDLSQSNSPFSSLSPTKTIEKTTESDFVHEPLPSTTFPTSHYDSTQSTPQNMSASRFPSSAGQGNGNDWIVQGPGEVKSWENATHHWRLSDNRNMVSAPQSEVLEESRKKFGKNEMTSSLAEPSRNFHGSEALALTEVEPELLLVVFIDGFKGTTNETFAHFPNRLEHLLSETIPQLKVKSVVFPAYETKDELDNAVVRFTDWLTALVVECEVTSGLGAAKAKVALCGHSMAGLLVADTLRELIRTGPNNGAPLWPNIVACIAYDTPYYGIRPFVVKNSVTKAAQYVNTATSIGTMLLSSTAWFGAEVATQMTSNKTCPSSPPPQASPSSLTSWAGTAVGQAILAGTVAGKAVLAGAAGAVNYQKDDPDQWVSWVTNHLKYVGNLWDEGGLEQRVGALIEIEKEHGVVFRTFYSIVPQNPPEFLSARTFIVLPKSGSGATFHFLPAMNGIASDEIQGHTGMFSGITNDGYYQLGLESARIIRDAVMSSRGTASDERSGKGRE